MCNLMNNNLFFKKSGHTSETSSYLLQNILKEKVKLIFFNINNAGSKYC